MAVAAERTSFASLHDVVAWARGLATAAESWPAGDRHVVLTELDRGITALSTARSALLVAERKAQTWKGHGDPTFDAWVGRTSGTGARAAAGEVRRAEMLDRAPDVKAAVEKGHLTLEHVDVVARLAAGTSAPVRGAVAAPERRAELLAMAERMDAGAFAKSAARWAARVDQAGLERSRQGQRAARFLTLSDTPAGVRLAGLLDADAGHRLRLALEAVSGKPAPDDDRSSEQRRADALEAMAGAALATPPASTDGPTGRRPHVSVLMTPETWAALRDAAGQPRGGVDRTEDAHGPTRDAMGAADVTRATAAPVPAGAPATLEDGSPVAPSELARILCDCELSRVVLRADGEAVDLGRTVRSHTPAQRRAVTARDRGCAWPGCGTPARWCEVHHLVWWDRDRGESSVRDGALLCSFHHHEVHRLDLVVTRFTVPRHREPDERSAAYVVTTPGGEVLADGRDRDRDGARVGHVVRTWVPGSGGSDGAPPRVLAALGLSPSSGPPPAPPTPTPPTPAPPAPASPTPTPPTLTPSAPAQSGRADGGARRMSDPTGKVGPWTSS